MEVVAVAAVRGGLTVIDGRVVVADWERQWVVAVVMCCRTCKTLRCDYISQSSCHISHFYFRFSTQPLLADHHHPNVDKG